MRLLTLLRFTILTALGTLLITSSDTSSGYRFPCDNPTHPDYDALMAFYNATDGPNWTNNSGWGEDCDVCGWYGVSCNNDAVYFLDLPNNNLTGTIPSEIGNLTDLEILRIHRNSLTGEIPSEIENLALLREFQIGSNDLDDVFPVELFSLPNLNDIRISNAGISGSLPDLFGNIPFLRTLEISNNEIEGNLPPSIYSLANLGNLAFSNTNITGGFADLFAGLPQLWNLNATNTPIGGVLPPSLGEAKSLTSINLANCELQGPIPESMYSLPVITTINLSSNNLTGGLDENIGQLTTISTLNLNYNEALSGHIPENISGCINLRSLYMQRCNLSGGIPEAVYSLENLTMLSLANNPLTGEISETICNLQNLTTLNLSFASLDGDVPKCFKSMNSLRFVNLSNNNLNGDLGGLFTEESDIINLILNDNLFSGSFPEEVVLIPNLNRLQLDRNRFAGCIPDSYTALCNVSFVNLDQNCTFENPSFSEFCTGASCNNTLNLSTSDPQACEGEMITLESPSGYSAYEWSVPGSTSRVLNTTATESQFYYITITNNRGCMKTDSIFIEVSSNEPGVEEASICPGQSIEINGQSFSETGEFSQTIPRPGTCDSTVIVTIIGKEPTFGTYAETICEGTSTIVNGEELMAGNYSQTITNVEGCDSIIAVEIAEFPTYNFDLEVEACQGNTYNFNGMELSVGPHTIPYLSVNQCDSIYNIEVLELSNSSEIIQASYCEGGIVIINNEEFASPDTYERTITNAAGCDSFLTIVVEEIPATSGLVNLSFCEGGSVEYEGNTYDQVGEYPYTLTNTNGCDSFLNVIVTEIPASRNTLEEIICSGQSYEIGNESFNTPGPHDILFTNSAGCDSIVTLTLTIIDGEDKTINATSCQGEAYPFGGNNYYNSTTVVDSIIIDGCKSEVTLNLTVLDPVYFEFDRTICEGESQFFDGQFYDEEITVSGKFISSFGCDSIVTMNLLIAEAKSTVIDTFICPNSILEMNGFTFSGPDNRQFRFTSSEGCDSIVFVNVDLYEMKTDSFQAIVCEGNTYEFLDGNSYFSGEHSGTYNDGNCIQNFNLVVAELAKIKQNPTLTLCQEGAIEFMGVTYTSPGLYAINEDVGGCEFVESLVVLESSNSSSLSQQILCAGTDVTLNGSNIISSGSYDISSDECSDEFVLIEFIDGEKIFISETLETGSVYIIEGYEFTESGIYEIQVGEDLGCPTSIELELKFQTCEGRRELAQIICAGESVLFFDNELSVSGIYTERVPLAIGCDSLITMNLDIIDEVIFEIEGEDFICDGGSTTLSGPAGYQYLWSSGEVSQEISVDQEGSYELTIFDEDNCPSYSRIDVSEISFPESSLEIIKVDPSTCTSSNGFISIGLEDEDNFLYSIDAGISWQESSLFVGLENGAFSIALADKELRCIKVLGEPVILESDGVPGIQEVEVQQINQCTNKLGSIIIFPVDNEEVYIYSIDGGNMWQETGVFENLEEGDYEILMKVEGAECVNNLTEQIEIRNIGILEINANITTEVSCSNVADGESMIEILQGLPPYDIQWSNGQTGAIASGLSNGSYEVTVTDGNNCVQTTQIQLDAVEVDDLLSDFQDEILCENDTLTYEINDAFSYLLFRNDIVVSEGNQPSISEPGDYQIVVENGSGCVADRTFKVERVDLSRLGIDFLLATEGVVNVPVIVVNISNPLPDSYEWLVTAEGVESEEIDRFSRQYTFKDTGTYTLSLLTEVDGCLTSYRKDIIIYSDSSYLGTFEEPEEPVDISRFISWEILPNPNNGEFLVKVNVSSAFRPVKLKVADINGSLISKRELFGSRSYETKFNLVTSGTGIYTVLLEYEDFTAAKQILVIK